MLDEAIKYHKDGFIVLALIPKGKMLKDGRKASGKSPYHSFKEWKDGREEQKEGRIRQLFIEHPDAELGIILDGKLNVLDLDPYQKGCNIHWSDIMRWFPCKKVVMTRGKEDKRGYHFYYSPSLPFKSNKLGFRKGLDVKVEGILKVPPSEGYEVVYDERYGINKLT